MTKAVVLSIKNHVKHAEPVKRRRRAPVDKSVPAAPVRPAEKPRPRVNKKKIIEESRRWLSIINAHKLNDYKRRKVVTDTIENFRSYYNRGYLEYRKSVTEGGEFAAIEWSGKGSYFEDVTGRKFIDCLGGYGIYSVEDGDIAFPLESILTAVSFDGILTQSHENLHCLHHRRVGHRRGHLRYIQRRGVFQGRFLRQLGSLQTKSLG